MSKPRYRKHDAQGRTKGAQTRHIRLHHYEMASDAWGSLNCVERCLYLELLALYNGQNNGEIGLSVRVAAELLRVHRDTATKAFTVLQQRGFIKIAVQGAFTCKQRLAREFELTAFERDGRKASKDYMGWRASEIQNTVLNEGTACPNPRDKKPRKRVKKAEKGPSCPNPRHKNDPNEPPPCPNLRDTYKLPGGVALDGEGNQEQIKSKSIIGPSQREMAVHGIVGGIDLEERQIERHLEPPQDRPNGLPSPEKPKSRVAA